mgnify:CR=1 FL=1
MARIVPTPEMYRELFETNRNGAAILEQLLTMFSKGAVTAGGIDAVLKTFKNSGNQEVVQFIVGQINIANGEAPLSAEIPQD